MNKDLYLLVRSKHCLVFSVKAKLTFDITNKDLYLLVRRKHCLAFSFRAKWTILFFPQVSATLIAICLHESFTSLIHQLNWLKHSQLWSSTDFAVFCSDGEATCWLKHLPYNQVILNEWFLGYYYKRIIILIHIAIWTQCVLGESFVREARCIMSLTNFIDSYREILMHG